MKRTYASFVVCIALSVGRAPAGLADTLQGWFDANGYAINVATDELGIEKFIPGLCDVLVLNGEHAFPNPTGWYVGQEQTYLLFGGSPPIGSTARFVAEEEFGFYIDSNEGRFWTETGKNADGFDHALVFINTKGSGYIIAFEDLWGGGDKDYTDRIIQLQSAGAYAGPDQWIYGNETATLDGTLSQKAITFAWRQIKTGTEPTVIINNARQPIATFTPPGTQIGYTLTFRLTVTGEMGTDTDEVWYFVRAVNPPEVPPNNLRAYPLDQGTKLGFGVSWDPVFDAESYRGALKLGTAYFWLYSTTEFCMDFTGLAEGQDETVAIRGENKFSDPNPASDPSKHGAQSADITFKAMRNLALPASLGGTRPPLPPVQGVTYTVSAAVGINDLVTSGTTAGFTSSDGQGKFEDFWGYLWVQPHYFERMVYYSGQIFGDGGWFTSLKVQYTKDWSNWIDIPGAQFTPVYDLTDSRAGRKNFTRYDISFPVVRGTGIRIYGTPGGTGQFTSIAELEVYGDQTRPAQTLIVQGVDAAYPEGGSAVLDGSVSFSTRGSITSWKWEQVSGPTVTINNLKSAVATFTAPIVAGDTSLVFKLTAGDGTETKSDPDVLITVKNLVTTAAAGADQRVLEGTGVTLDGLGSTSTTRILMYLWTQTAGTDVGITGNKAAVVGFTAPVLWAFTEDLKFRLDVNDASGGTSSAEVVVTIYNFAGLVSPLGSGYFKEMLHMGETAPDRILVLAENTPLAINTNYLETFGEEAKVNPRPGECYDFTGTGVTVTTNPAIWTPLHEDDGWFMYDGHAGEALDNFVQYYHVYIISPEERDVRWHFRNDDEMRIWNNGSPAVVRDAWDGGVESVRLGAAGSASALHKGVNSLTLKFHEGAGGNEIAVGITDLAGNEFTDLQYSLGLPAGTGDAYAVRTLPDNYKPGASVPVSLSFRVNPANVPASVYIREQIPPGLMAADVDAPGAAVGGGVIIWSLTGTQVKTKTVEYSLNIPAGMTHSLDFAGTVSFGTTTTDTVGDNVVYADITEPVSLTVEMMPASGTSFLCGQEMVVSAEALHDGEPVLAAFVGALDVGGPAPLGISRFYDDGTHGDDAAGDKVYSTTVTVPLVPVGEYLLRVTAKAILDGKTYSGSSSVLIKIKGQPEGAPSVKVTATSPNYPDILVGEVVTIRAEVGYPGGISPEGTQVSSTISVPGSFYATGPMLEVSEGVYEEEFKFWEACRHIIDVKAVPPASLSFAPGYGQLTVNVYKGRLNVEALPTGGPYKLFEIATLSAKVTFGGKPVQQAAVTVRVTGPETKNELCFTGEDGVCSVSLSAQTPGDYSVRFEATDPELLPAVATTSFQVSSEKSVMAEAIASFSVSAEWCFGKISKEADRCADEGDAFAGELVKDQMDLVIGLALDLCGVVAKGFKLKDPVEKAVVAIKLRLPGLAWLFRTEKGLKPVAEVFGRETLEQLDAVLKGTSIVWEDDYLKVALGAIVYSATVLTNGAVDDTAKSIAVENLAQPLIGHTLSDLFDKSTSPPIEDFKEGVLSLAEEKLANMPALSPEEMDYYIKDLVGRRNGNDFVSRLTQIQGAPLHRATDLRENEKKDALALFANLLIHCAPTLVCALADGPGWAILALEVGIAVYDAYTGSAKIDEDRQMSNVGFGILDQALRDSATIYSNTASGIIAIEKDAAHGGLPAGQIENVTDIAMGHEVDSYVPEWSVFHGRWCEEEAYSEVKVRNTGDQATLFRLFSVYQSDRVQRVIETFSINGEATYAVSLIPQEERDLRVYYHKAYPNSQTKIDLKPDEGTPVDYHLLAYSVSGAVHEVNVYRDSQFNPERRESRPLRATALDEEETPIITDEVAASWVVADPDSLSFEIKILVSNPFPCPISARVTQELPDGLEIVEAVDGKASGRSVLWNRAVQPHTSEELALMVDRRVLPDQVVSIPGSHVELYDPGSGKTIVFGSPGMVLGPVMPLRAQVFRPLELVPRHASNFLCRLQNLLPVETTGSLVAAIKDESGGEIASRSYPLTAEGGRKMNLVLPMTEDLAPGRYVLNVALTWGTMREDLHEGWLTVLADEDGDGMPTNWEETHNLSPLQDDASQDADGDGLTNYGEWTAQTDPRDNQSHTQPPIVVRSSSTPNWEVGWTSVPGRLYEVEWSQDGLNWQKAVGGSAAQLGGLGPLRFLDDGISTAGDSDLAPGCESVRKRFYRVVIHVR